MKRVATVVLLLVSLISTGCDDKTAQDYANKLAAVLTSYQEQVNQKIKAEQASYKNLSAVYARAQQEDLLLSLELKRQELTEQLTDTALSQKRHITLFEIHRRLQAYATEDFEATRRMLEQESGVDSQILANLDSLEFESSNIEALAKALQELGKPKGTIKQLKDLATFAKATKDEFDKDVCNDLAQESKCLEVKIASLTTKLGTETDQSKISALKSQLEGAKDQKSKIDERRKTKNCAAATNVECPEGR